jgi:hypothetical protein
VIVVVEQRENTVPELDAVGYSSRRGAGGLLPIGLTLSGQGDQHLLRPRTVAVAVELYMSLKVVSKVRHFGFRIAPEREQSLEHLRDYVFSTEQKARCHLDQGPRG